MVILLAGIAFPSIVTSFTTVYINGQYAEFMTAANMLAMQQMEIILADKAGTGAGFGYANITSAKYSSVNPASPWTAFTRTVTVTAFNINGNASYPGKMVEVRVTHPKIPAVVITTIITDTATIS